jgi:hypothetical protein
VWQPGTSTLRCLGPRLPGCATGFVHHYFEINLDVLSATVTVELPKLLEVVPRSGSQI